MQRVINFSGGQTSAYMTIRTYREGDLVIFTDTGREHPKTYKFINDFEAHEGIPVIRVSFQFNKDAFRALLGKYKYKQIPNRVKRFCTSELKIKTCKRYLRSIGITTFENFVGFRADEPKRVLERKQYFKRVFDKFPLYEQGITKPMINEYWKHKPYRLEIPPILGNCTLCFMKGKNAIINILKVYPELADEWIIDEDEAKKQNPTKALTYFTNVSIRELRDIAQNNLFKDVDLTDITPAYNCACTT
jgi:3'-phosphoadenosine 5'-phosphosulfate sulfotransferase (PAPS reductase)/FAD synthetase